MFTEFYQAFSEAWYAPWIKALLVILASLVVARIANLFLNRVVRRLTRNTGTNLDDELIGHLARPVYVSVVLVGVYVALTFPQIDPKWSRWAGNLIQTVAIVVWMLAGMRICTSLMTAVSRLSQRVHWIDSRTLPLIDNLARLILLGGAAYFLLISWNLNVGPWLASAGIVGIAVGFAAKDTIANIFGGLFVIVDAPYQIGDFINLDTGERGKVVKIGLRSTRLLTRDDVEITVPNAVIANAKIVNESGGPHEKTRIAVEVGVAYGSDVDRVRVVLMKAALAVEHVLDDPEPRIRFIEMGDSALIWRVMCWIDEPVLRGRTIDGLNTSIYKALNAEEISIPFPQRDVHVYQASPSAS